MRASRSSFIRLQRSQRRLLSTTPIRLASINNSNPDITPPPSPGEPIVSLPSNAPRPNVNIRHIRQNPQLHQENCLARNYKEQATYPSLINDLFEQWQVHQRDGRGLRERSNALRRQIVNSATIQHEDDIELSASRDVVLGTTPTRDVRTMTLEELLEEARGLKTRLTDIENNEARLIARINALALALPNLTSPETPRGDEPRLVRYINDGPPPSTEPSRAPPHPHPVLFSSDRVWRSHVHIGAELGLLDFAGAATSSGWGWYYLVGQGAQLEQALISYALSVVRTRGRGWVQVTPPSMVYSHIAAACGFQPRDQNGEQQIYTIASDDQQRRDKPRLCLAGTAEIPLAGMKADSVLESADLPLKRVGLSRCYRAEAGARGASTKGLYRVHEFTKLELFAWTPPAADATTAVFDEVVDLQAAILEGLGLRCRVLEMPTADLGASAERKRDIETVFPSRRDRADGGDDEGWGEVTSASVCTDYQTRRLATRLRLPDGRLAYPFTVNGTAMAVPRVLAAVLEHGWDEEDMAVTIPECLRPWMDGRDKITIEDRSR
ncbi:seryl-tRNA synthetase [Xylariaceae sp. FL0662B]|nr:seryl-tRNA synthetase [Xylariaceae sp. FL0662B]